MAPLNLLCSPKTVTPRAKIHLKRSKPLVTSFNEVLYIAINQLVLEIWLKNGINLFHDFYDFDQWICHCSQTPKNFNFSYFLSLFPEYMSYQDLHYLILKLSTKSYGLSNHIMDLGVRVLGLEDKVGIHYFFTQTLCI